MIVHSLAGARMHPGRRRRTLPRVPLDFADRIRIPPGEVVGAGLLSELPPDVAPRAWAVLRLVLDFAAAQDDGGPWFDTDELLAWEEELLRSALDPPLRSPLAVIVGELAQGERADRGTVAHACWCVVEWALDRHEETALAFAEAAALSWPQHERYAMIAGRLFRKAGRTRDAELWLRRARRLSLWVEDWETLVLSTSSLAMLFWDHGNFPRARQLLKAAGRVARRQSLRTLEGEVMHNRLVLAMEDEDVDSATDYAAAALERYLPTHNNLPALAFDVAHLWLKKGFAQRALRIFDALLPHFADPKHRIQILGAIGKSAGLAGERDAFDRARTRFDQAAAQSGSPPVLAAAIIDLATGAAAFDETAIAEDLLRRAITSAEARAQADAIIIAERMIGEIRQGTHTLALYRRTGTNTPHDKLAERFVCALRQIGAAS